MADAVTRAERLARIVERHYARAALDPIREAHRFDVDPDQVVDAMVEQGLPRGQRS